MEVTLYMMRERFNYISQFCVHHIYHRGERTPSHYFIKMYIYSKNCDLLTYYFLDSVLPKDSIPQQEGALYHAASIDGLTMYW